MAKLKSYWFYHGTTLTRGKKILKHGFKISKKIGSLGIGAYAFANSINDAKTFALRRCKYNNQNHKHGNSIKPCVIAFKLTHPKQILDFTKPLTILVYEHYTEKHRNLISSLVESHRNSIGIKKLDGAILDSFTKFLNNRLADKQFLGIYNLTQNDLYGEAVPYSQIPNSMELVIKSNRIISNVHLTLI